MARSKSAAIAKRRSPRGIADECAEIRTALDALNVGHRAEAQRIRKAVDAIQRIADDSSYFRDAVPLAALRIADSMAKGVGGAIAAKEKAKNNAAKAGGSGRGLGESRQARGAFVLGTPARA